MLRSHGLRPVDDREVPAFGAGAAYSSTADMARYVDALLHQGANTHGSMLKPATLASMFEPYFQPDPRVPGMGLGFTWARRVAIAPSVMTASFRAFSRR